MRRIRGMVGAVALAGVALAVLPAHASTGTAVTVHTVRGSGLGFDICTAPSSAVLRSWSSSPYRSVNIYFGGSQRGCPNQPNLTTDWVTTVLSNGWSLIPTYVDLQPPCYGGSTKSKMSSDPATAASQGASAGQGADAALRNLGLGGAVSYLDIENFDPPSNDPTCAQATLAFVHAYTTTLHSLGDLSGLYFNAHHGGALFVSDYGNVGTPDDVWVADWNNQATPDDTVIGEDWTGHRIHQYASDSGNQLGPETYGANTMTIDRDAIDGDVVSAQSVSLPAQTSNYYAYAAIVPSPDTLHERQAPASSSTQTGSVASGSEVDIVCQTAGEVVNGDPVWDHLTDGSYVTDLYTTTTGRNTFSGAIPRCDTTAPTISVKALPTATLAASVPIRWIAADPANSDGSPSGVTSVTVRYKRAPWNGGYGLWTTLATTSGSSATLPLSRGYTYCVEATARDASGNASAWSAPTCTARALDDRSFPTASGWSRKTSSHYYAGTYTTTTRYGVTLARSGTSGDRVAIVATTCQTCGSIRVSIGSHVLGTINLHASATHYQQLFVLPRYSLRSGTVSVRSTSSGKLVQIDGLVISRA